MKALIAGCGYVGTALGAELVKAGHEVWGLRRDVAAARSLEAAGIRPIIANLLRKEDLSSLPPVDTVVLCQAPSRKNDDYQSTYFDSTRSLLSVLPQGSLRRLILVSSTSVYAAADGGWVDETTDPMAGSHADIESRENAKIMLAQELLVLGCGHPAMVFRLAGIYGPGRNRVRSILDGRIKPTLSDVYMNRIHLHDLVRGIRLLLDKGKPGELYLGADDAPCTQREFYSWLCERLGLPTPTVGPASEASTHGSNKRCSNRKIKALGLKLRYPTYKEGYEPLIAEVLAERKAAEKPRAGGWFSR